MTEEEQLFLKLIEERNNNEYDQDDLPAHIEIAIDKMIEQYEDAPAGVKSESIADLSVTYFEQLDPKIAELLNTSRKMKW